MWEWKVGFLNGFGDAFFEVYGEKIRRVTKMVTAPTGQSIFIKAVPCLLSTDEYPEFPASMVLAALDVKPELIPDLTRCWEGGRIIPGTNGGAHPRFSK